MVFADSEDTARLFRLKRERLGPIERVLAARDGLAEVDEDDLARLRLARLRRILVADLAHIPVSSRVGTDGIDRFLPIAPRIDRHAKHMDAAAFGRLHRQRTVIDELAQLFREGFVLVEILRTLVIEPRLVIDMAEEIGGLAAFVGI